MLKRLTTLTREAHTPVALLSIVVDFFVLAAHFGWL
jgi:hypothetical protein